MATKFLNISKNAAAIAVTLVSSLLIGTVLAVLMLFDTKGVRGGL